MIVVDASALVAIGDDETDADALLSTLIGRKAVISSINYAETGLVLIGRRQIATQADLDHWLERLGVSVHASEALGFQALATYLRFGKRFHPAKLNLADCFAYALAKELDAPLLYKGNDFALTDVKAAL